MILVDLANGMEEQNVDKTKIHMKTATGFTNLLKISKNIPNFEVWYIFVDLDFDHTKKCIESANYYLSETREEDDEMDEQEDRYRPWLDYGIFLDIIDNKLEHQVLYSHRCHYMKTQ